MLMVISQMSTVPVIYYIGTKLEDLRQVILFCTVPVIYYIGTKR